MLLTIITFIIVLSVIVFVHELGHFLTARKLGVKVEEFGFGFPPRIWGYKKGETIYSINWIPIGGFVKIKGEDARIAARLIVLLLRAPPGGL
jgi:regulator of sigma E protease